MMSDVRLTLRLPEATHGALVDLARRDRRSLNATILTLLDDSLDVFRNRVDLWDEIEAKYAAWERAQGAERR